MPRTSNIDAAMETKREIQKNINGFIVLRKLLSGKLEKICSTVLDNEKQVISKNQKNQYVGVSNFLDGEKINMRQIETTGKNADYEM